MVAAVGIRAPQAGFLTVLRQAAEGADATQFGAIVVYNIPSAGLAATQAGITTVLREEAPVQITQANILAVVKGRVANPRIRAWTFTLDGHDFYVLRLGDKETLVYDLSTEQWVEWTSGGMPFWRLNTGMSWLGAHGLGQLYGSNIVVGDDAWGLLWFLDPEQPYDQHPDESNGAQELEYSRVVTGQAVERGREVMPCNAVFLVGDNYGLTATEFDASVTLEYSDDAGKTYVDAGAITVTADTVNQPYQWRSLGQISSPGRLFRITDNGVFTRIDDMKMNDD
jgi:hypothetical protein